MQTPLVRALALQSDEGEFIGLGQTRACGVEELNFWARSNYDVGVNFDVSIDVGSFSQPYEYPARWTLDYAGPGHAPLTVGTYDGARFEWERGLSVHLGQFCSGRQ
jgi:hypothetical protein